MNALRVAITGGHASLRQLMRHVPGAEWVERPGAIVLVSGSPIALYNGLALTGGRALDDGLLDEARRVFAPRALSYSIRFEEALIPQGDAFLSERGYTCILANPVMVLMGLPEPLPGDPTARIELVCDLGGLHQFRRIISAGFDLPLAEAERLIGDSQVDDPAILNYLVRLEDEVVGAGTFILVDGIASVWNVVTRPAYQRRGIGAALMQRGLADARARGAAASMLWSSEAGLRLYVRLGYRTVTHVRAYVPPP